MRSRRNRRRNRRVGRRGGWRALAPIADVVGRALLIFLGGSFLAVLALRWIDPWTSAFMLQERVAAAARGERGYRTDYRWVDFADVSPHAAIAVVAAEDQKFPDHAGFDFDAIAEAIEDGTNGGSVRGASTISQQVAKNVFLWPGRSFVRKAIEAYFTVLIEALWPKRRILEVYVNVAEFGPGVFGVEAAAQRYFQKPASRLDREEAARLAAVLPSPRRLHADRPSDYVRMRTDRIQESMARLGGAGYLRSL